MMEHIHLPPVDHKWKLISESTGLEVKPGDVVESFRGEMFTVEKPVGTPPHKPSSTGRINTDKGEFYPSVCGCKWV